MTDLEKKDDSTIPDSKEVRWERDLLNRLAFAAINEQRRTRRWSIFFKLLLFVYLIALLFIAKPDWWNFGNKADEDATGGDGKHTALIEIEGVIAQSTDTNADNIITGLRAAYKDENTKGIILRINSPGGSPVQAGYINDEIVRLREKHNARKIGVYAVITDICASGGYYIASAADEIYADKGSLVGSIGVIMSSFGFVEAIDKLGIERRLLTAGEHKGLLDPFSPTKPEEVTHIKGILEGIHKQFIETVKRGRGDRLKDNPQIFSGLIWTGEQAKELGLVDELGSSGYVAREKIKAEKIVDFTHKPNDFFNLVSKGFKTLFNGELSQSAGLPVLKP